MTTKKSAVIEDAPSLEPALQTSNAELSCWPMDSDAKGLTKAEYAMIHFVAAHLGAHGKYPTPEQLAALSDLSYYLLNVVTPRP
jgi:hypothetical protein